MIFRLYFKVIDNDIDKVIVKVIDKVIVIDIDKVIDNDFVIESKYHRKIVVLFLKARILSLQDVVFSEYVFSYILSCFCHDTLIKHVTQVFCVRFSCQVLMNAEANYSYNNRLSYKRHDNFIYSAACMIA